MTLNRFFARLSNFLAWPLSALRHDTEQRFRATFEQAAVGLSRVAPDGRLLQVNQKLCEITGYSQAELLTRTFQSITHPDDLLADVALSQQLLSGQIETYTLQKRYIRKDTGKLWIRLTVSLVRRPDGSPDYFISVVEDIDQSMQIRAQLRISDLALKAISQGVLITGPDQRIQCVNAAFTSITGYAESDIVGLRCRFLQGPLTDPVQIAQIKHCLDQGMAFSGDILNYRQDGSPFWNELTITALRDEQGELSHFIGITRDISERKHAQAELGRYQHHLEHLVQQRTAELTQARDDADAANLAKRDFLANVSHELRTPLNAVLGLTGLLVDSPLGRRQRDYAFKIESSAQALRTLIDDILDFSRIESGELQLEHAPFSLHAILRNTAAVLGVNLHQKPVEALFDVAADVPDLFIGDTLHLQQIVLNLTNNAAKFTAQGEIVVRVRCSAQSKGIARLQLAVHDTGMGIAADKLGLIFNRFTQGTPSDKRLYGGTGLGLAISARLADLMQAELRVQSVLGEGSVFTLDLPLAVAESQPLAPLALHLQALKILIVDDNASSRAVLAQNCTQLGWHATAVDSAAAGLNALQQSSAQHQEFDLMLLDWRMPGTDGLALLRQAYVTPGIGLPLVLLMVPAFELEQAVAASDDLVLDGMLSKPITPDSLREAVTRAYSGELQYILPPPGKSDRRLSSLRLLVAEDNELNQEVIEQTLRRAGAEVVIARDGQAAVNALKIPGVRFDAVLMDIQMPVMDGYEATRVIRHELGRLDLPIIALTTLASPQSRQKSRLAGMVGHLVKPLNVDDLLDLLVRERHRQSDTQQQARARQPDGIDLSSALQAFGGDAPKYREMMRKFVERHAQDASRGHELLGAQDLETLTGLVHGLRGVASLLYATEVARLAGAAENALLSGQHERLTALLDELQKALDTLAESVDQL